MEVLAGGRARPRPLTVDGRRVAGALLAGAAALVTAGLVAEAVARLGAPPWLLGLVAAADLDGEGTLPAWFASATLLAGAALLHLLGREARERGDPQAWGWSALGWLLVVLSIDETAQGHERLGVAAARLLALPGPGAIAWTFLGCGLVLGLLLVLRDFLAHLPADLRRRLLLAGALYAGGSLLLDGPGAGPARVALEESLELLGLIALVHALLGHVAERAPEVALRFGAAPAPPRNAGAPEEPPTERSSRRVAA